MACRPPSPRSTRKLDAPPQVASARVRTRWWLRGAADRVARWVYDAINNLAPLRLGPALVARPRHPERRGLARDRARARARPLARVAPRLGLAVSDYYDNAHFIVTLAAARAAVVAGRGPLPAAAQLAGAINLLGFVVFWLYPVAPPRMLGGFTDVVATTHAIGSWHTGALASQANQLAAMPSLHIAWAVWCTVAIWRLTRRDARARARGAATRA